MLIAAAVSLYCLICSHAAWLAPVECNGAADSEELFRNRQIGLHPTNGVLENFDMLQDRFVVQGGTRTSALAPQLMSGDGDAITSQRGPVFRVFLVRFCSRLRSTRVSPVSHQKYLLRRQIPQFWYFPPRNLNSHAGRSSHLGIKGGRH